MILARLPIRVLGKMRSVCKHWNSLLSSRDALPVSVPNWSLHSTPGFLIQIDWDWKDDVEYWVTEGPACSNIYKLPLLNRIVLDSCKGIFCCHRKGDRLDLSLGIPGAGSWRRLPRPAISPGFIFSGMAFDSSTRRCTLLLGFYYIDRRIQQGQGQNRRIMMCIYDSDSNAWNTVSMMVPDHIQPSGNAIFSKGKFYWATFIPNTCNIIVAFNIADGQWSEIPMPEGRRSIYPENLVGCDGKVGLVDHKEVDCLRIWKLNETENFEIWCELRESRLTKGLFPLLPFVALNSSGLIMVIDWKMEMSIFNSNGKLVVGQMRLPGLRMSQRPLRGSGSAFESNNLWWP